MHMPETINAKEILAALEHLELMQQFFIERRDPGPFTNQYQIFKDWLTDQAALDDFYMSIID